jgi:hypothetical protein
LEELRDELNNSKRGEVIHRVLQHLQQIGNRRVR